MSIRADSLAERGADVGNGGDVRLGELHADSLDAIELVMAVEEEFELEIPDEDAEKFRRVSDITAYVRKYLPAAVDA